MLYRPLLDIADRGASMGRTTSEQRFNMLLVTAFAGLALLLAVIGLYGVLSYAVTQRTSEIGVRLALGATDGGVSRMVVRQGLKPAIAGAILGLVAAALSTGLARSMRSIIHLALDNAAPIIDSPISHLWEHRLLFGVTCSASR